MVDTARAPTPIDKLVIAIGAALLNAAIYLIPNHLHLREPVLLPWTRADASVPFVPATVWIYFSDYLLVATAFFWCSSWAEIKRFAWAYLALLLTGSALHLAWPTLFPRDAFPVPPVGLTGVATALLRQIDLPSSCLPSMHVAGSVLAALSLWQKPKAVFGGWLFWAGAVSVSTLTAKQHYVIDVAAGIALAFVFWAVFFWLPEVASRNRAGWITLRPASARSRR